MGEGRKGEHILLLTALVVFFHGAEAFRYLGCFKDTTTVRLLSDVKQTFKGQLTIGLCMDFCGQREYRYFGVEWRFECFCTNDRPNYKYMADEAACNLTCDGDPSQACGANLRINVYDRSDVGVNVVANQHIGCFADTADRMFKGAKWDSDILTPENCVSRCYRRGFRFAGLENGKDCMCGDNLRRASKVNTNECSANCEGDERFKCGGLWRLSVYHTGIPDLPSDGNDVGCFNDAQNFRVLSALHFDLKQTNTPRRCMNMCLAAGFKYSGTEYGYECYCGNRKPAPEKEAEEKHCLMKCPGNKEEYCGGTWRILIYSTGFGKVKPVIPELAISTSATHRPLEGTRKPVQSSLGHTQRPTRVTTKSPTTSQGTTKPYRKCEPSSTIINGKAACKGQLIFRDDFVGNEIDLKKWDHEIFMPMSPDYEFVIFNDKAQNSYVKDSKLFIKPTILDDDTVRRGKIDLQNCTGQGYSEECTRQAATFSINPPVESARINTKQYFSFQYGVIQVRAKLPVGDWIIPELWLEPKRNTYGTGYASGRVRLAMARGNKILKSGQYEIGNNHLESGILMGTGENVRGRTIFTEKGGGWYEDFHNFTLIWSPDNMLFLIDGNHETELISSDGGAMCALVGFNNEECTTWNKGSSLAPFDREFYLSLGISVGGMRDFPDESVSGQYVKPWKNKSVKAQANFWQKKENWFATWNGENAALQVDGIKVYAL